MKEKKLILAWRTFEVLVSIRFMTCDTEDLAQRRAQLLAEKAWALNASVPQKVTRIRAGKVRQIS